MRVVIDMQGVQTESRFRGIGRYTLSFVQAVVRNRGDAEILLVLSDLFPETVGAIREAFADSLPHDAIRLWSAPGSTRECDEGNADRREVAEAVREAFIASLRPDVVHVTSLFEGFVDDAVTSIGVLGAGAPVTVALYDLIPLANPAQYLDHNAAYRAHYMRKVEWLRRASGFLAISEYSRREGRDTLGMEDALFHDVSTAIEADFAQEALDPEAASAMLAGYGIDRPFVLYTGGSDGRKNLERLIEAFARILASLPQRPQLVLAGRMPEGDIQRLRTHAQTQGLGADDIVFTGYVSDSELVTLYKGCACFAFPSWHEGFGLPALEAMTCGAPVIGSATSSIVEVINLPEAMFDPFDVQAIADRMGAVLRDPAFAARLRAHGLEQAQRYSWDRTSLRALDVWRRLSADTGQGAATELPVRRLRLAMVTPLPPERSGIADYSADLLPELAALYDVDVIVDQHGVESDLPAGVAVRDIDWFRSNAEGYDRIVYQVGNSPFHRHVPELMRAHPGVMVLHDFFLSSLYGWLEDSGMTPDAWTRALYVSHGLRAVASKVESPEQAKREYPSNFELLSDAIGVIVHSRYARELLEVWYGSTLDASVIPLLKDVERSPDKAAARKALGLPSDAFVVCSFGFLDSSKLNHLLVEAWAGSSLAEDPSGRLVFVGENHGGDYGAQLLEQIASHPASARIGITGFVDGTRYRQYLQAADVAVQMRATSRGETSAAVMDCMSRGVPLIINANGSLAEVSPSGAIILADHVDVPALQAALERLRSDPGLREALGQGGRSAIAEVHAPRACALAYEASIEGAYRRAAASRQMQLYARLRETEGWSSAEVDRLCAHLAGAFPERGSARRLLLDVTATVGTHLHTGIERVARGVLAALARNESPGVRIEPVYLDGRDGRWQYRHARGFGLKVQGVAPLAALDDDIVDARPDDVLLTLDISGGALVSAVREGLLSRYRRLGVRAYAMLFDLLPIRMPEVFPPGAEVGHLEWLESIAELDGAVCISRAVADDMRAWLDETDRDPGGRFDLQVTNLGSDIDNSLPTQGLPEGAREVLASMQARPTFLMVGSIEPRKGYLQALDAFSALWRDDIEVNLVVVGREGWRGLDPSLRRDIPQTVQRLQSHPEAGRRLHWLADASDEYLALVYAHASCLLAASFGEGFGLPLIEASGHGLPLLVRDIPVFREVAGDAAAYFEADDAAALAAAIRNWLALADQGVQPGSGDLDRVSWDEMAERLKRVLLSETHEESTS
ncbi:glycosyl transferase family 1 [Lysobacteraceae bacterium NML93-0792]|nr:glycosyl transferase family 1 [Xanthomonadaceae bacterium NML93-0792]PBS15286.1 glycosyl transferase family 1 [Xanthomonadaceae bacterium NML93-0793]PBS18142.1 glycosyl transferase family 1 [Xanthomonadaceae bacterium NML93-0831]